MIVSVCIVKGFQREVVAKLTGFASHLEVLDRNSFGSPETYPVVTDAALMDKVKLAPGVMKVQRVSQKMGIFKTKNDFSGVALKGVAQEYDLHFMKQCIVEGTMPAFRDDRSSNSIVISRTLSDKLGLKVGDKVYSYFFSNTIKQRRFIVAAIYDTHLRQFDNTYVLTDLYTVNKLNGWDADQSSGLEVRLSSFDILPEAQRWLSTHIGSTHDRMNRPYSVVSIHENPRTSSFDFPSFSADGHRGYADARLAHIHRNRARHRAAHALGHPHSGPYAVNFHQYIAALSHQGGAAHRAQDFSVPHPVALVHRKVEFSGQRVH